MQKLLKETKATTAVRSIFDSAKRPIDAVFLTQKLAELNISVDRATVFRILSRFSEAGILRKVEFADGKFYYELTSLPHHHHAVCTQCGNVVDVPGTVEDAMLEKAVAQKTKFTITNHSLEFFGLCQKCQ